MDGVIGIVVFVGLALIIWGATSLRDKAVGSAVGAVNRKVHSRSHAEGVELAQKMLFYPVEAPGESIIATLRHGVLSAPGVAASEGPPSFVGTQTYLEATDAESLRWAHGNRTSTSFRAVAQLANAEFADGTKRSGVVLGFPEVFTRDGVVADVAAMQALRHDVLTALRTLDPSVTEETS